MPDRRGFVTRPLASPLERGTSDSLSRKLTNNSENDFGAEAVVLVGVLGAMGPNGIKLEIQDPVGGEDPVPTLSSSSCVKPSKPPMTRKTSIRLFSGVLKYPISMFFSSDL